jgi:hypothetical protein
MAKRKVQKDKQWPTKHTYKTKERVTRTPLKTGVNSGAPVGWAVPAQNAFDAICTCVWARTEMTLLLSAFNSIFMWTVRMYPSNNT